MRGALCEAYPAKGKGQDHPRGCGEHRPSPRPLISLSGSSPRMRGAPHRHPHPRRGHRIIPADAGSTKPPENMTDVTEDHPRGCGEHRLKPS